MGLPRVGGLHHRYIWQEAGTDRTSVSTSCGGRVLRTHIGLTSTSGQLQVLCVVTERSPEVTNIWTEEVRISLTNARPNFREVDDRYLRPLAPTLPGIPRSIQE